MLKLARLSFFLVVLVIVGPRTTYAMSLFADAFVTWGGLVGPGQFSGGQGAIPGSNPAIASFSHSASGPDGSASGSAFAFATFGTLKGSDAVAAGSLIHCLGGCFSVAAESQMDFGEVLTITGSRVAFISATGTMRGVGDGVLSVSLGGSCGASIHSSTFDTASCTTPLLRIFPQVNPRVALGEDLGTSTQLRFVNTPPFGGTNSSDFTDTAFISTIHAFDINGNELDATDFTVTSESGFDYPTGPLGETPEPATMLLFGSTIAGLGLMGSWRHHR